MFLEKHITKTLLDHYLHSVPGPKSDAFPSLLGIWGQVKNYYYLFKMGEAHLRATVNAARWRTLPAAPYLRSVTT